LLAVIALSAALIAPKVAALSNALLYLSFALGCLVAPAVVRRLGDHRSLVLGTSAYAAFCLAYVFPSSSGLALAGLCAGCCGSVLWTAQGRCFSVNARLHARAVARAAGEASDAASEARAVASFAALFATLFPLALALFKVACALLLASAGTPATYAFLAACAGASVFIMAGVKDVSEEEGFVGQPAEQAAAPSASQVLTEVWHAHRDNRMLLLLAPTNVAFGLTTAFYPYAVTLLASEALGASAIGWLYALGNAASAAAAAAAGAACRRHGADGRRAALLVGALAFGLSTAAVCLHGDDSAPWGVRSLAVLFIAYGTGVAVWQGCVMAFFGDAFQGAAALPAFAALKLQSGLASALCFFLLPHAPRRRAAALCSAVSALGYGCYLPAEAMLQRRITQSTPAGCELAQIEAAPLLDAS